MTSCASVQIHDLGVPVRSVNWVQLYPGRDRNGTPCILITMGQEADNLFVLQVNPETGEFRQFVSPVPDSHFPTAGMMSRDGRLYVGSAYAGHLLRFEPSTEELLDLGAIAPGAASFPCRMDEDSLGRIWIGSYGSADLTCYDPEAESFTRYGRMDEVDMYNYPLVVDDDHIACLIRMTQPHVVVFEPESGKRTNVGPMTTKGEDTIDLFRGSDGNVYIESTKGDYRVEGSQAVPVDGLPERLPVPLLRDGASFSFADADEQLYRRLTVTKPDGHSQTFEIDYEASGSRIFYVHRGPNDRIYGSSILPLHLFRYSPEEDELVDLGRCSSATGEAYSMANLDGRIYISSYPGARVSMYDPSRPYHYGENKEDNPRELGRIDEVSYRPRSTLAGPMGRVWLASIPDYGLWGGPLSYYDPATETKHAYDGICGDASCYTLAYLEKEGLLAVGTSVSGGSGTRPKVDGATLFLWDCEKEEKVWEGTLDRQVSAFNALLATGNGQLWGTVTGSGKPPELFLFDQAKRAFVDCLPVPGGLPLDLGLQMGPEGRIYGFTQSCIYALDPQTRRTEILMEEENAFSVAGPILGNRIYFAMNHRLRCAEIP